MIPGAHARLESIVDHDDEAVEQIADIVRTRAGFGMALEAEGRSVGSLDALQRAVEQRFVRDAYVRAQR